MNYEGQSSPCLGCSQGAICSPDDQAHCGRVRRRKWSLHAKAYGLARDYIESHEGDAMREMVEEQEGH